MDSYFKLIPDVDALLRALHQEEGDASNFNYASPWYAKTVLSVNPFLVGNDQDPGASSLHFYWNNTTTIRPPNLGPLFEEIFEQFGLDNALTGALMNLYERHQVSAQAESGRLYQLCVDRDSAEKFMYMSRAHGTPDPWRIHGKETCNPALILDTLAHKNPEDGFGSRDLDQMEARLLLHPELYHRGLQVNEYLEPGKRPLVWKDELRTLMERFLVASLSGPRKIAGFLDKPRFFRQADFRLASAGLSQRPGSLQKSKVTLRLLSFLSGLKRTPIPKCIFDTIAGEPHLIKRIYKTRHYFPHFMRGIQSAH